MSLKRLLIGREDHASFPNIHLDQIEIKIDTGAYTSSMHCHKIRLEEEDGKPKLRCNFLDPRHEKYHEKTLVFEDYSVRKVKSSNGIVEERYSIKTGILIFDEIFSIELTLTERGTMRFPVLLGRKFLSNKFIVDPSLKNLSQDFKKIVISR